MDLKRKCSELQKKDHQNHHELEQKRQKIEQLEQRCHFLERTRAADYEWDLSSINFIPFREYSFLDSPEFEVCSSKGRILTARVRLAPKGRGAKCPLCYLHLSGAVANLPVKFRLGTWEQTVGMSEDGSTSEDVHLPSDTALCAVLRRATLTVRVLKLEES